MRTKQYGYRTTLDMDAQQHDAVEQWGKDQRPSLNFNQAVRTLLQRALDMEALKQPGAYLAAYRQMQQPE